MANRKDHNCEKTNTRFKELTDRLLRNVSATSSASDLLSHLKFFQLYLQGILKHAANIDIESYSDRNYEKEFRLNRFPVLPYDELYSVITNLMENMFKLSNQTSVGEHLLKTYHVIIPFLDCDSLDGLPLTIASSLIYLHPSLQNSIMDLLCAVVIPFVYSSKEDHESYAIDSIPSILMYVFQHVEKREYHSWLVESLLSRKRELYKDLFMVVAYGSTETRLPAVSLLFHYWPELCPSQYQNSAIIHPTHYQWEAWKPISCERTDCPNKGGKAFALKMTVEPRVSAKHANKPPPLYVCLDCADALNRRDFDKLFDVALPSRQISMTCESKTCRSKNNIACITCASMECALLNGGRPIRFCDACHRLRHCSTSAKHSTIMEPPLMPSTSSIRFSEAHIFQAGIPDIWSAGLDLQPLMVEAAVALCRESSPRWRQVMASIFGVSASGIGTGSMCADEPRLVTTLGAGSLVNAQGGPGGPSQVTLDLIMPITVGVGSSGFPVASGAASLSPGGITLAASSNNPLNATQTNLVALDNLPTQTVLGGKNLNSAIASLPGESEVCLAGKYTDDDHKILAIYGAFLVGEKCRPLERVNIEILTRITAGIFNWFLDTVYTAEDELGELIERVKSEYIMKWLQEVLHLHLEAALAVLLPHPVEYARVGSCWDSLCDKTAQVKHGFSRINSLIPYDIITFETWDYIIPYWLEAMRTEVPQEDYKELEMILKKVFDATAGPFPFVPSKVYHFATERFKNTPIAVQDQVISWIEMLTSVDVIVPMKELLTMFKAGVDTIHYGTPIDEINSQECSDYDDGLDLMDSDQEQDTQFEQDIFESELHELNSQPSQPAMMFGDEFIEHSVPDDTKALLNKISKSSSGSFKGSRKSIFLQQLGNSASNVAKRVRRRRSQQRAVPVSTNIEGSGPSICSDTAMSQRSIDITETVITIEKVNAVARSSNIDSLAGDSVIVKSVDSCYRITNCLSSMLELTFKQLRMQDPYSNMSLSQETSQLLLALLSDMLRLDWLTQIRRYRIVQSDVEANKTTTNDRTNGNQTVVTTKDISYFMKCAGNCTNPAPASDLTGDKNKKLIKKQDECVFCAEVVMWFELAADICQQLAPSKNKVIKINSIDLDESAITRFLNEKCKIFGYYIRIFAVEGNWRTEVQYGFVDTADETELLPTDEELLTLPPLLRVVYQLLQLIKCPPNRHTDLKLEYRNQDPVITRCILTCLVYLCHISNGLHQIWSAEKKTLEKQVTAVPGSNSTPTNTTKNFGHVTVHKLSSNSTTGTGNTNAQLSIGIQANFARYLVKYHLVPNLWDLLTLDYSHIASWIVPMLLHSLTMPGGFNTFWSVVKREFEHPDWRIRLSAIEKVAIFARQLDETVLIGNFNGSAAVQINSRQPQTITNRRCNVGMSGIMTGPSLKPGNIGRGAVSRLGGGRLGGGNHTAVGGVGAQSTSNETTRFLSNCNPIIMCAVAHSFCSLIGTLNDCSNVIAQQTTIQLSHISNHSLSVCIKCLEYQFDTVPSDRTLVLQRMGLLASALPDRQIFNWDFFLNRFGLLAIEAQIIGKPNVEADNVTDLNQHNKNSEFFQQQCSKAAFACLNSDALPSIQQKGAAAIMVRRQGENSFVPAALHNPRSFKHGSAGQSNALPQLALINISYDAETLTMAETLKRERERYISLDLDPHYARLSSIANSFLPDSSGTQADEEEVDQIANLSRRHSATYNSQILSVDQISRRGSGSSIEQRHKDRSLRATEHFSYSRERATSSLDRKYRRSIDPATLFGGRRKRPSAATYNLHTTSLLNESEFTECTNKFLNSIQEVLDFSSGEKRSTLHLWVCLLLKFMTRFELEPDLVHKNATEDSTEDLLDTARRGDLLESGPLSLSAVGGHRGLRSLSTRDELRDKKALSKIQRHLTFLLGYSDQAFNIPPYKLRASTVFHAFISNVAGLLDRNYAVGNCILPQTLMILQYCPSPQRYAHDSQPPTFTLRTLDRTTRISWLNTFLYEYVGLGSSSGGISDKTVNSHDPMDIMDTTGGPLRSALGGSPSGVLGGQNAMLTGTNGVNTVGFNPRVIVEYLIQIVLNTLNAYNHICQDKTDEDDTYDPPTPQLARYHDANNLSVDVNTIAEMDTPSASSDEEEASTDQNDVISILVPKQKLEVRVDSEDTNEGNQVILQKDAD